MNAPQKVAIVHYWFTSRRGGEAVVESLLRIFPHSDVFTHVFDAALFPQINSRHSVRQTFIGRVPGAEQFYRKLLPLMPVALEQLDLRGYDLVISSESGPAKGVLVDPDAVHVCYCHSPMRYLWDMYHDYREGAGLLTRLSMVPFTHYLRLWDRLSADRVDHFIANSAFIRRRIQKIYRREATVVNPPVNVDAFELTEQKDDFYLLLGQLTAYKRPGTAVEAFANMTDKRLVVIGQGELLECLSARQLPNITFLGHQPFESVRDHLQRARALVFPGVEDFGIVPVEALACGTPVIGYGKGGLLETVTDGVTGIHYHEPSAESLADAVQRFEAWEPIMNRASLREAAEEFSEPRFRDRLLAAIKQARAADASA